MLSSGSLASVNSSFVKKPGYGLGCCAIAVLLSHLTVQAQEIEEMLVTGSGSQVTLPDEYAGGQVARGGRVGLFGNLDMMDAPFAGTAYTADLVKNQQSQSVGDVLKNDPVVRVAKGFGNFQEVYIIRGFPVFSDDMTYNGLYGILPRQYVAAELLERVEVFRGASAFLNGAAPGGSGLGGAVNLVPKRAGQEPSSNLTLGYENRGLGYAALDTSTRFANEAFGVRVNLVKRKGETAVEDQERDLSVLSVGLDYQGEQLRLSADIGFQDHRIDAPRPDVTPMGAIPRPPKADSNYAQPWTYTDERQWFGVVRGEYDLTDNITIWVAGGGRQGEEENVLSGPNAFANGDTTSYRFDNSREDDVVSGDTGLRATFATGAVEHRLTISASAFEMKEYNAYAMSDYLAPYAGNLYSPIAVEPPAYTNLGGNMVDPLLAYKTKTSSIAIADMLSFFDGNVLLTLGARQQTIEKYSYAYFGNGDLMSDYDESKVTPIVGLVVKPTEGISVYANFIEGLIPGEVAPIDVGGVPVVNGGEIFKPYQAEQYEVGVKYDAEVIGGTLSLFTIDKPNAYVENNVFDVHGIQRNRGIELSVYGQLADSLRIIGGATVIDAEMEKTPGGLLDGNDPVGTPDTQVNLNLEWDVVGIPGLTLDGRAVYTADQYIDAANTIALSSWTRFDIGARYNAQLAGKDLTLRLRVDNVAGKDYWASVGGYPGANYLALGAPRTLSFSGTVHF